MVTWREPGSPVLYIPPPPPKVFCTFRFLQERAINFNLVKLLLLLVSVKEAELYFCHLVSVSFFVHYHDGVSQARICHLAPPSASAG